VLKNYEQNRKDAARTTTNVTQSPKEAFDEIMKNPAQALQKIMQQNYA
jgi:seryl-tRNA(Sec) selenium transferase